MNEEANVTSGEYSADYSSDYSADYQEYQEPTQDVGNTEPSPTDGSASTFAVRVDPRNGRREVISINDLDDNGVEQTEPAMPEMATPQQGEQISMKLNIPQQQPQKLQNYANAGEVIAAMNSGTLDESRIPVEMAFQYAQFRQQLALQASQPAPQPQQPDVTEDVMKARQEYFSRVESMAKENALKDVGLSEDELLTAEYSDDPIVQQKAQMYSTALSMHRNNILQAVQAERNRQQSVELAQKAVISNVNAHINQLSKTEPHFQEIINSMQTLFKDPSVGFDNGARYLIAMNAYNQGSMTDKQATDLQEYWNLARRNVYARINNIGQHRQRSPYVEGSVNSSNMQNNSMDRANLLKQLRSATDYRVKRQLMGQLLGK